MTVTQVNAPAPPTGKALWMSFLGVLVATIVIMGVVGVWAVARNVDDTGFAQTMAVAILLHSVACCLVIVAVVKYLRIDWYQLGVLKPGPSLWHALWQVPLSLLAMMLLNVLVFSLLGIGEGEEPDQGIGFLADLSPAFVVVGALGLAVFTPLWEELLFRGIMLRDFHRRWGLVHAIVWSSLIFAVVHLIPLVLPYLFTGGLIMALMRRFHGNIWGGVLLHVALNSVVCAAFVVG